MFKKLHNLNDQSQFSISQDKKTSQVTYKKNFIKNNTEKNKNISYGEKFRKKNHLLPNVPNLEIIESDTFIFQGRLASVIQGSSFIPTQREKHGEGVMFLKNGTLIVGYWDHGLLHGRALIFTPFGGKTIAQFYNGKLNGWAITIFAQKLVVCAIYYDNKIDGEKIIFQANEKMWVGSKYISETNSYKIVHLQKGTMNELPDFIKFSQSTDLMQLYDQFINNEECGLMLKEIQTVTLTESLNYIGYCNEEGYPNGLGCIFGKNEFYMGHFRDGSLECYGRMIFQNGEIYQGELLNGVFYGQGTYYNPSKNISTVMSTTRDEQKVLDEQQGYICINSSLNYFKYNKHGQTGMYGDSLATICETLQKYYSRFFIEKNHNDNSSANSEFGVSENVDEIEELSKNQSSPKKKAKAQSKNISPQQEKRWLNFKGKSSQESPQYKSQAQSMEESSIRLHRAYSLDKRQAAFYRKNEADRSSPVIFEEFPRSKQEDQSLDAEISNLRIDRNFSLNQRKNQNFNFPSPAARIPNDPYQLRQRSQNSLNLNELQISTKRNTLNVNEKNQTLSTQKIMTFRNIMGTSEQLIDNDVKNERKYSHMVESNAQFSPQDSVVSNLSHKVEGMMKQTSSKRKKIFM